jgi:hypothetical protein
MARTIEISEDEYTNAFGTDDWRKIIRHSVTANSKYLDPDADSASTPAASTAAENTPSTAHTEPPTPRRHDQLAASFVAGIVLQQLGYNPMTLCGHSALLFQLHPFGLKSERHSLNGCYRSNLWISYEPCLDGEMLDRVEKLKEKVPWLGAIVAHNKWHGVVLLA